VLVGHAPAALVLAVAVLGGCVGPLLTGGLTSLLRDLVPEAELERAYGLDVASYTAAGICGPALTAFVASFFGPSSATLVLAASAGAGALLIAGLPLSGRYPMASLKHLALSRGLDVMWQSRPLRAATVATSIGHLGIGGLPLTAALIGAGPDDSATAGAFLSALAVGALFGSLAYARRPITAWAPEWVVVACLIAMAIPLACVPLAPGVGPTLVLFAIAGFFGGPLAGSLFVVRDREAPANAHTQVFTLGAGLKITAAAVGAGLAGIFAGISAERLMIAIAGCQLLGAMSGALLLRSRPHRHEEARRGE
jgi:MFS family permease